MAPINQKNDEILNKIFKGNQGKEAQIANDSALSNTILIDILIGILTPTQKAKFDEAVADWKDFTDNSRSQAMEFYTKKQHLIGKKTVMEEIEVKRLEESQEVEEITEE